MASHLTIKEIAEEAHVGIGTVSRALNNSPNVSEKTRERILEVVKKHNYTPNPIASKLGAKTSTSCYVGLILSDFNIRYFFEIFQAIYWTLRKLDIHLLILEYTREHTKGEDKDFISQVQEMNLSGLIFFSWRPSNELASMLHVRNVPFMFLDPEDEVNEGVSVATDNHLGGTLAAQYLISHGVKHPCYIHSIGGALIDRLRFDGFKEQFVAEGLPKPMEYSVEITGNNISVIAEQILKEGSIDGVFCFCDDIAIEFLKVFRKHSTTIRIIGFDGIRDGEGWGLSTISQNPQLIGRRVAEEIISLMQTGKDINRTIIMIPSLVDRNS